MGNKIIKINIRNRKAKFDYELLDKFVAGIELLGTEIKSIRCNNVNINDSYCYFNGNQLFLKNSYIKEYEFASHTTHDPLRERKLLLTRKELNKMKKAIDQRGVTIVPMRLFINDSGFAKIEIFIAKGKRQYDKRQSIKERETEIDIKRYIKNH